jgi:hypothetical protein
MAAPLPRDAARQVQANKSPEDVELTMADVRRRKRPIRPLALSPIECADALGIRRKVVADALRTGELIAYREPGSGVAGFFSGREIAFTGTFRVRCNFNPT